MSRLLVIDDDADLRKIMQHMLEGEGHDVFVAKDDADGLQQQRDCAAELIITDIFMPNKEGIETIRAIREEFPDVTIIAMSGGGRLQGDGHLFTAKELGAVVILRKPFELTALVEAVQSALNSPRS